MFFYFQAKEGRSRSQFLSSDTDRWTKESIASTRLIISAVSDMKNSNDIVSTGFESEARTWMDGLKGRIDRGGVVFRGELGQRKYADRT